MLNILTIIYILKNVLEYTQPETYITHCVIYVSDTTNRLNNITDNIYF